MTLLRCMLSRSLLLMVMAWATPSLAIVGGIAAAEGDVTGQVALVDVSRAPGTCTGSEAFCKQFCSGVLVARQWALTAAHCVAAVLPSNLRVVAGTRDLSTANASHLVNVARVVVHNQYGIGAPFNNDIALLELDTPVDLPVASIAEAPAYSALVSNTALHDDGVTASGWGRLSSTGGFPATLRRVAINLLPDSVCQASYNGAITRYVVGSMLCAAETTPVVVEHDDAGDLSPYDATGEGVCNYDSGGPLTFWGNGFRQVAGLTSFAPSGDCASATLASVFTHVANYAAWIEASGKDAGDNFGDLALVIDGDTGKVPGVAATITVRMNNASGLPAGVSLPATNLTGAGFTVVVPAGATLALSGTPASLTCVVVTGGYRCTSSTTLAPSSSRQATFTVTPSAGQQRIDVEAEAFADAANNLVDYRQGNNSRQHRILFSSQPDVNLELAGFSQEVVNITPTSADGRAWIMGRISNRSSLNAATTIDLGLALPVGWVWEAWEGLPECVSVACQLTGLAPGEERTFRVRVFSSGAAPGNVALTAAAANGDFPVDASGSSDTQANVDVAFNVVLDDTPVPPVDPVDPPAAAGGSGGGGSVDTSWLLMVLMTGWLVRRRK